MYYFAYGSNMDINHFFQYICKSNVKIIGGGYVSDYIFRYRRINVPQLRSGVANIEPRKNSKTYGVIYAIDDDCVFTELDKKEGYISQNNKFNKYHKIQIECKLLDTEKSYQCFTYQMNDYNGLPEEAPRTQYIKYLENGHWFHKLPTHHLKRINYIFE